MKHFLRILSISTFFMMLLHFDVFADVTIDKSNISNGIVSVRHDGESNKVIKAVIDKGSDRYIYTIKNNDINYLPLQMGIGDYKISVLESVGGNKYKSLKADSVSLSVEPSINMFTYSTPITNFNNSMNSIKTYSTETKDKDYKQKVSFVYLDVIKNYTYDFDKIRTLSKDYVPNIDVMFSLKKGICYDYAALMSGVLRSQNIPTKLVMGYAPEIQEYHAWNEIYLNNKWQVVDTTYDAAMYQAGQKPTFSKDPTKFKVLKVY